MLSSYRLTYLIVYDGITSFLRAPFLEEIYEVREDGEMMHRVKVKGSGLRRWIGSMLSCHWCVGIWSSTSIVLLYWQFPALYPLFLILAIAGGAAMIQSRV